MHPRPDLRLHRLAAVLLGLLLLALAPVPAGAEIWLRVITAELRLDVMEGERRVHSYPDIAIGRYGTTTAKRAGDGMTPLGKFRILEQSARTDFHRFFVLDYPNLAHARAALSAGRIRPVVHRRIEQALRAGRLPPQHTGLGGFIGIHGLGEGDPAIHAAFNWTEGCIALTNAQIDDLAQWVGTGTRVIIE